MVLKFDEVGDLTNSNQNHHVQVIFKKSCQKYGLPTFWFFKSLYNNMVYTLRIYIYTCIHKQLGGDRSPHAILQKSAINYFILHQLGTKKQGNFLHDFEGGPIPPKNWIL